MSKQGFEQYAQETIRGQPIPPRRLHLPAFGALITDGELLLIALIGLVTTVGGFFLLWQAAPDATTYRIIITGLTLLCAIGIAVPFLYVLRWYRALRAGRLATARITTVRIEPVGSMRTLRTMSYGGATGTWEFWLDQHRVQETFALDTHWATQLRVGSQVQVLVHPTQPRILMPVGL